MNKVEFPEDKNKDLGFCEIGYLCSLNETAFIGYPSPYNEYRDGKGVLFLISALGIIDPKDTKRIYDNEKFIFYVSKFVDITIVVEDK